MTSVAYGIAMPASRGVLGRPFPLLVDRLSAAPTAAFATFRLTWAYIGPCIRVRRSSDNQEADIGSAGASLDTASLLSFCGAGDGFITKWYDQSGNARHLSQATALNQPQIVTAGSLIATINGLPSVQFDGTNDLLAGAALANFVTATAYGIVSLSRPAAGGSDDTLVNERALFGDAGGNIWHGWRQTKFNGGHWNAGDKSANVAASYPSVYVAAGRYDGVNVKAWLNGGAAASFATASGPSILTAAAEIGLSQGIKYFQGTVAAVITFGTALSLSDLNATGADWTAKAGIAWSTAT